MTVEIALVFLITACALYLFATQKLPIDVTALGILVTVMAIPLIFHSEWLVEQGVNLEAAFPTISEAGVGAPLNVILMVVTSCSLYWIGV